MKAKLTGWKFEIGEEAKVDEWPVKVISRSFSYIENSGGFESIETYYCENISEDSVWSYENFDVEDMEKKK